MSARWGAFSAALHDFEAARQRLQAALAFPDQPREKAFALFQLGWMAVDQGERAAAEEYLHESLAISRDISDLSSMAEALSGLAKAAFEFGDFEPARQFAGQSLAICRQLARPDRIAGALGWLAWPTNCLGDYRQSEAYWREGLALYWEIGDSFGAAINLNFLGWVAWCEGGAKLAEAIAYHKEALTTYRELGRRQFIAMCLGDLALASVELGDTERAMRYARDGLAVAQEIGIVHLMSYSLTVLGAAASEQGDGQASRDYLVEALRTSLDIRKADSVMNVVYFIARLLLKESAAAGDAQMKSQKRAQAFELLALVIGHPATWQAIKDRANRLIAEWAPAPPDAVTAPIVARNRPPDWETVARRLIHELADRGRPEARTESTPVR